MNKKIVLFIAFMDVLGFAIFIPALPEIAKYFNISLGYTGFILTVYALFSFLFTPILGQLSDKYGRKYVLFLSVIGTFLGNLIIYFSPNFWIFLIGRIIDGATGGNISVIQSILSDISKNKKERTKNMGYIGALFGISFIIGPFLGGFLIKFGVSTLFLVMLILSIVEIFVLLFFKETIKEKFNHKISYNPFGKIWFYIKDKNINYILISFFLVIFAINFFQLMFPVILNKDFLISGEYAGYIIGFMGIIGILNQMFLLKKFWLNKFDNKKLIFITNTGLFFSILIMGLVSNLYIFLLLSFLNVIFMGVFRPVYTSEIIDHTKKTGEILGVLSSLRSLSMIIAPFLSGIFIEFQINIFIISSIFVLFSLIIIKKYDKNT